MLRNRLELFIDRNLLEELHRVLDYTRIKKLLPLDKHVYSAFVPLISTQIKAEPHHIKSPDPEDNYLYDIALTAHAKLLVTGEKALLKLEWFPGGNHQPCYLQRTFLIPPASFSDSYIRDAPYIIDSTVEVSQIGYWNDFE